MSWGDNLSGGAGLLETVIGEEQSREGEGFLVTLDRQRGQQENAGHVQGQQGDPFGFHCEINADRSRNCDQGGNWGQEADVSRLVHNFSGLWLFP